ncbi:MAG: FlgD immunoglobulin-like domain containing protein [Brevinematia bacterium]
MYRLGVFVLFVFLSLTTYSVYGESYYYFEPFSTTPTGWWYVATGVDGGLWYGRDGTFPSYGTTVREASIDFVDSNLVFDRRVVNSSSTYGLGTWVGCVVGFTNKLWNPTPYNPFGFEILRKAARIDPQDEDFNSFGYSLSNPESRRHSASMSIFLAVYSNLNNSSPDLTKFPDQIVFYDMMRMIDNTSNTITYTPYSQWGYWKGSYSRLYTTNVPSLNGTIYNIKPILEWNMDNDWIHPTNEGKKDWYSQYPNTYSTNTNYIKIMMTHDGGKVQFFVNPNPNNLSSGPFAGIPNAMLKLGEASVGFSSNVFPLMGVETIRYDTDLQYVVFDDFYIRTIASSVTSEISPYQLGTNSTTHLNIFIKPIFGSTNDAGVSEIHIKRPVGWTSFSWASYTNSIAIMVYSNTTLIATFGKQSGDFNPNSGNVSLSVYGDTLKIRFRATSWADNQIIRPISTSDYANKFIRIIISNLTTPSTFSSSEDYFDVYVDNPKYGDTWTDTVVGTAPRYATTGRMKSYSGDALNVPSIDPSLPDGNTLYISVLNIPRANGGITPNMVYQGTTNTFYYYVSTAGFSSDNPLITTLKIRVPSGFIVKPNTAFETNISSILITNPINSIRITNEGGITNIYIEYWKEGKSIPSVNGLDEIVIKTYGTPIDITNRYDNWFAYVNNKDVGGIQNLWVMVSTNSSYPSRTVESRRPRAKVAAWIVAQTNDVSYIENTSITNIYKYVLRNEGLAGNNIAKARIMLPSWITNVSSVSTTIPANTTFGNIGGTNFLTIDFQAVSTNLPAGTNCVITFVGWDNVPPLTNEFTNSFPSWVDNLNGDGWVPTTASFTGLDIRVITPPPRGLAKITSPNEEGGDVPGTAFHHVYIDTNDVQVQMYIQNEGENGNDIFTAYIYYPNLITNVANISSVKLGTSYVYTTNIGGSNFIVANYDGAGNRLLSGQNDTISFRIRYNVNNVTNLTLQVYIANSTNFNKAIACPVPFDNNQDLHFIYSRVSASNWLSVPGGYIDRASSTNQITFTITNLYYHVKNSIMHVKIKVPSYFSTNVYGVSSDIMGSNPSYVYITTEGGNININVTYNIGIYGTYRDVITAYVVDHINYSTNVDFIITVSNKRGEFTNLYTNSVLVSDPPVNARYGVSNNVIIASNANSNNNFLLMLITNMGTGANELTYVKIDIPSAFQGKITNVIGSWTNVSYITWDSTKIELSYSNVMGDAFRGLPASGYDLIKIYFSNNMTNVSTNGWAVWADNSPEFPPITNIGVLTGYTSNTYIVLPSTYYILPNSIASAQTRSVFTNYVNVGSGYSVSGVKIYIPYPFVTNDLVVSSARGASWSLGSNYVILTYSTPIPQNQNDTIVLSNLLSTYNEFYSTNTFWFAEVDYGDGKGFDGRTTLVEPGRTNVVDIIYNFALAEAYVEPINVSEDFSNYTYTFTIKNIGEPGNEIKEVTILPSAFITNITSVTSAILGTGNIYISNNNIVVLKYWEASKSILPSSNDTITLVGWDNIDDTSSVGGITNSYWVVRVNNSTVSTAYTNARITEGRSLSNIIERPNYRVDVYLEMFNRISGNPSDYYKVYSTSEQTNQLMYYVFNLGGAGNSLEKLIINIPAIGSIVKTNGMQVSSAYGGITSISNGKIIVQYTNVLIPGANDVVTIKFKDNLVEGETNIVWYSTSVFTTTAGKEKTNNVVVGKVNYVSFVMPLPYAVGYIVSPNPKEIYTSDKEFDLTIVLSNTGVDKNIIRGARIDVPGFALKNVISAQNANYSIVGNSVYLNYLTNFEVGMTNYLTLRLSNVFSSKTNLQFTGVVWNSKNINVFSERSFSELTFKVEKLPSMYVLPNAVDTSDYFTNYLVSIKNDTTGVKSIYKVKIELPIWLFSTLSNISSTKVGGSYISNDGNSNIIIDYDGSPVSPGDQDSITFFGYDTLDIGSTNVSIDGYFDDGSATWRKFSIFVGYTNNINYVMPPAYMKASITPTKIYVTEFSNDFKFTVTNEGKGSNKLLKVRFNVPWGFVNLTLVSNRLGGIASNFVNTPYYEIWYSNTSGISASDYDEYYFVAENYYEMITNVSFIFMAGNEYGGPWYLGDTILGGSTVLNVQYPPLLVLGYINKGQNIYTINTNATIEYKIINRSRDVYVTNVIINFDFTNFNIQSLTSFQMISNASISITNIGNLIVVNYPNGFFDFNKEDLITIKVSYNLTNFYPIVMTGQVWVTGATNTNSFLVKPFGLSQVAYVTNAPFGRIKGYVTPYRYSVNIKQVDQNGNVKKDSQGNDIVAVSSTADGSFYIQEAYPDSNNKVLLMFENENYRFMIKEFTVEKNKNNFVGTIYMLNKPFSKSSQNDQDIVSGSDNKSKVIVKSGDIDRDFSVDLYVTNLTELQKYGIQKNGDIGKPSNYDSLKCYFLDVRGYSYEELLKEVGISGDIILYFYYPSVISNAYANEDKLGIYYWKDTTGDWIRLGGQVDKVNKFIISKVSYLHRYYGIFESSKEFTNVIRNVNASPKVFTPVVGGGRTDPSYGVAKISFEFDKPYNEYEVSIYSVDGRLVKRIKKQSSEGFINGEIGWDGTDMDGKMVRSGVYIFRIKAGENVYTGTIVLVK